MLHEFCGFGKHIKPGSPPWISAAGEHSLAVKRPLLPEQKDQSVLDLLAVSRACFWWVLRATHTDGFDARQNMIVLLKNIS